MILCKSFGCKIHIRSRPKLRHARRHVECSMQRDDWSISTRLLHPERESHDPYRAIAPPLYQTATFDQPSATEMGIYDYSRSGNPTRTLLEEQIADLEKASKSFAFSSGMAALSVACKLIPHGESIMAGDDLYGGSSRLLAQVVPNSGIRVHHVDTTDLKYFCSLRLSMENV